MAYGGQLKFPASYMRGGTSKGLFILTTDFPVDVYKDTAERDRILMQVMGRGSSQIDGVGGANSLTSKVAFVSKNLSTDRPDVDVDYYFAQVSFGDKPGENGVSTRQSCGNMLLAVGPFGIEHGLVGKVNDGTTTVRVFSANGRGVYDLEVQTPGGEVNYTGDFQAHGVPETGSKIKSTTVRDVEGSICGRLFPTGFYINKLDGVPVTMIDVGMPVALVDAYEMGLTGRENVKDLNANEGLKERIEAMRLQAGHLMNLEDIASDNIPKMILVSRPREKDYLIHTQTFNAFHPVTAHKNIGVAMGHCVLAASYFEGTVAYEHAHRPSGPLMVGIEKAFKIGHPTGFTSVGAIPTGDSSKPFQYVSESTARIIWEGNLFFKPR